MDRIKFSKSINNFTLEDLISYFDELMTFYNIVADIEIAEILSESDKSASFVVTFKRKEDAGLVYAKFIHGVKVSGYDSNIYISALYDNNKDVTLTFMKV